MQRMLIIQTAFIGDVILATPVIEKLHTYFPNAKIDFLLRKGNESLLDNHPFLNEIIIWKKQDGKYQSLLGIIRKVRSHKYDLVINLHRFLSSGIITFMSASDQTIGFDKNPLSIFYSKKIAHILGDKKMPFHEVERNLSLVEHLTDGSLVKPKLYPSPKDFETVKRSERYVCIAPTSVWFTKQWPAQNWIDFIDRFDPDILILLLGGRNDYDNCQYILTKARHQKIENLAGELSFLESAALMKGAFMNYVNDSAPLHIASSMNAPVTAVFCSTVPEFGFGPLSDEYTIAETEQQLDCRPCGLHGFKSCPKGHFKCADINLEVPVSLT